MKKRLFFVTLGLVLICSLYFFTLVFLSQNLCPLRGSQRAEEFPSPSILSRFSQSQALPAYASKYNTTCQTCHTAFPNLTPFGEAFHRLGHRFPGEGETFESPNSMPLGEESDKEKFPKAVWPGALPKSVPFSFTALSQFISEPRNEASNQKSQMQLFGGQAGIFATGTLGSHFAVWGGLDLSADVNTNTGVRSFEIELERLYAVVNPFKKNSHLVIRVGSFDPRLLWISSHRGLLGGYFVTSGREVGDNAFTLEGTQQGIEFSGIHAKGRFGYSLGVVEGSGNRYNNYKDFYGRVEYKVGGLRLDGVEDEKSSTVKNLWRDDSITLGAFGYQGFATLASPVTEQQDRFHLLGGDVNINYANFVANLAYAHQNNNRPLLADPANSVGTNHALGEVLYVYHWFIPGLRYEFFDNEITRDQRLTLGSTFLIRPNIKTFVRGSLVKIANGDFTDNSEIRVGLTLAL